MTEDVPKEPGIFSNDRLLETIQLANLYPDSKTFVDKKLKCTPKRIEEKFNHLWEMHHGELHREQIMQFVEANFDEEGLELEPWVPNDWTESPSILKRLTNPKLVKLMEGLNHVWLDLSRKISGDVKACPELYSIIYVPNGFVVPGGRFREFYYWDTYWIVKALLICEMFDTVKGTIENFLLMVDTYGLIPNGGRIYYIHRSQPPLLSLMVKEYFDYTKDYEFLEKHIHTIEKEMEFWEKNRSTKLTKNDRDYTVFFFGSNSKGPRPESYREDYELAKTFPEDEQEEFYRHMKGGAESGWDYSTRWMIDSKMRNVGGLRAIKTSYIVPVDLVCVMAQNYRILRDFHKELDNEERAEYFDNKLKDVQETIDHVLWCPEDEIWYDYDLLNNIPRRYFYPSNLYPLWTECYDPENRLFIGKIACNYLNKTEAVFCHGGVPTSLVDSGQQWDFPNAWPPLQHILVEGLLKTGAEDARRMALAIARRYTIGTMFEMSDEAKQIYLFEKYNANHSGKAGFGGEYEVQTGFGWSNGVVIAFMDTFGDELMIKDGVDHEFDKEDALTVVTQFDLNQPKALIVDKNSSSAVGLSDLVEVEEHFFEQYGSDYEDEVVTDDEDEPGIIMTRTRRYLSCCED